jgi:hypothetical protein
MGVGSSAAQRPILNFTPRGKVVPQGRILSPGGEVIPGGEILSLPLHSSKQLRVFTPGGERRDEHSR